MVSTEGQGGRHEGHDYGKLQKAALVLLMLGLVGIVAVMIR